MMLESKPQKHYPAQSVQLISWQLISGMLSVSNLGFTAYAGDFTEDPGVLNGESVDDSQNISYEA